VKVLFAYKYLTLGGVESVLRARLEGLPAIGVDAHAWFLSDGPGQASFQDVRDRVHIGGLHDLQRWVDSEKPHAITSIDTEEVFPALADIAYRIPVILEIHSPYRENRAYLRWLRAIRPRAYFVPSRHQSTIVAKGTAMRAPVLVVPNPLRDIFVAEPEPSCAPPPNAVVAWIGRLDAAKDWQAFLRIGRLLGKASAKVELWMVGEAQGLAGHDRLFRKAKREQVLPRLKWYPSLAHDVVPRLLDAVVASGGVLTSTSRTESFGMTIAEGMARACAVVAPNEGPFPELVGDGIAGRLYRPGDEKNAAGIIADLLSDPTQRNVLGLQARSAILERHAPDVALRVLADSLERVLGLG